MQDPSVVKLSEVSFLDFNNNRMVRILILTSKGRVYLPKNLQEMN